MRRDSRRPLRMTLALGLVICVTNCTTRADSPTCSVWVRLHAGDTEVARFRILSADGMEYAPAGATVRTTKSGASYFYEDDAFRLEMPAGRARVFISGGMEYVPQRLLLDVASDTQLDVYMRPWIDMASRGWYSGDSHVHLHTGGPINVSVADALLAARAEGVHYVNLCVSNNVGDDIRDVDLITGTPHPMSTASHLLVFGEEMRSSIYGHMQFFGISRLVEPQYTGFDNTPHHYDFPANHVMAEEACRQGGVVTYGHPMFRSQPFPFGEDLTADNAAARELPIDAVLNVVQAVDLMSYNSDEHESARLWYRLLNCGLRLSACVGTDALLDQSTDPMGGSRVYVDTRGPLTMQSWLQGLAAGRTFVTNGPMLQIKVEDSAPGETVSAKADQVTVRGTVESHVPFNRVQLIVNGRVVLERNPSPRSDSEIVQIQRFETDVVLERSSWVALRVQGPDHPDVFDGHVWAHTSPVYVLIDDKPIGSAEDSRFFVDWIDQLLRVVAARNRYRTAEDRMEVESVFRRAQKEFRRRASP